ncbi:M56 family metallopeptidase [Williamsia herbipolensis]|uniref:M56 family metallopeptidase n=1 Tax=Williamsia herbipolensis TaxID=1603258 RepID=UPI0005F7832C|nr:M56 family metallopeptidase [Williamsia herbipolensis]
MTLALTFVVAAIVVGFVAPVVLTRMESASPRVQLLSWFASLSTFGYVVVSAVAIAAWPDHAPAERVTELWTRCLSSAAHALQPWLDELIIATALALGAAAAARTMLCARRQFQSRSTVLDYHRDVVAVVARTEQGSHRIMWLDHPVPMAYSVAGRPGFVVATEGLSACLTAQEREAVLAHERAHLDHRHHRIQTICGVLSVALPFIPLLRIAPNAVAALLEYEADRSAAEATSAQSVRSALIRVSAGAFGADTTANLNTELRLRHLSAPSKGRATTVGYIASLVLPVVVTLATGIVTVTVASLLLHTASF